MNRWDDIVSIDGILNEYKQDKELLSSLYDKPEELVKCWKNIFRTDPTCRVKMSQLESDFTCIHCNNMKLFMQDTPIGNPFKVATGTLVNDYMLITETSVDPYIIKTNKIKGDEYTIKILLTWYLEKKLKQLNIPFIELYYGFLCGNHGYLLYNVPTVNHETCNIDSFFNMIDEKELIDHIYGILLQFVVIYDVLKDIKFSLGHSDKNSFLISDKPCNYKYKDVDIECKYTLYLSYLANSTVNINNIEYTTDNSINAIMNDTFDNHFYEKKDNYYMIKKLIKHKLPLSIDLYLLLSSLVEDPYYYHIIKSNEHAFKLWKKFWIDYEIVVEKLKSRYENNENDILIGLRLYNEPTEFLF